MPFYNFLINSICMTSKVCQLLQHWNHNDLYKIGIMLIWTTLDFCNFLINSICLTSTVCQFLQHWNHVDLNNIRIMSFRNIQIVSICTTLKSCQFEQHWSLVFLQLSNFLNVCNIQIVSICTTPKSRQFRTFLHSIWWKFLKLLDQIFFSFRNSFCSHEAWHEWLFQVLSVSICGTRINKSLTIVKLNDIEF
jgi:hypothetical protein